jgi:hypothetical protein
MNTSSGDVGGLRDDPVILLGMHHSGTSIFAEVLHRFGVFMQADMAHHESKFFTRDLNDRLIMGGGDGWARTPILPVEAVMAKLEPARKLIAAQALKKYRRAGYDGVSAWGFKDPRTCVTLPLFLAIFPRARLLHIVRQEADVAESLATSEKAGVGVIADRDFWRQLQRQHVARVREYGRTHPSYFEFAYEEFCRQPVEVTRAAFDHIGLTLPPEAESFLTQTIYTHRIDIASTGA